MKIKQAMLLLLSLGATTQTYATADIADSARCYAQEIDMAPSGDGCSGDYCKRQALICLPRAWGTTTPLHQLPADKKAPVVLAFHGKGIENLAEVTNQAIKDRIIKAPNAGIFGFKTNLHGAMPSAIVVYFQGLPITSQWTPSTSPAVLTDNLDDRGWQVNVGTTPNENRDLMFVYQFYAQLLQSRVESDNLYAVGYSNGSRFAGVLWNRSSAELNGSALKAIAFSAAQAGPFLENGISGQNLFATANPRSIFMGMGTADDVVEYSLQQQSIPLAADKLQVSISDPTQSTTLTNANGLKLQTYIHNETFEGSGHVWPVGQENMIRDFFNLPAQ